MKKLINKSNGDQKLLGSGNGEVVQELDNGLLSDLAGLLGQSVEDVKEDCYLSKIKQFMNRIAQVNVRLEVSYAKLEKLLLNADKMETREVLVSPVYLSSCKNISNDNEIQKKYSVIIDFPFGESTFTTKKLAVKESIKKEVKSITVTMPSVLVNADRIKEFKKQTKKIGVMASVPIGVAFNATDMSDEQIKEAVKKIEKTKIDFLTFMFGDSTTDFVLERMALIKKCSSKKPINILGNIDRADVVKELVKMGVNTIYTPYADDISKEIVKRFNIKKIKLF